jgi:hypothetical protein
VILGGFHDRHPRASLKLLEGFLLQIEMSEGGQVSIEPL